MRQPVCCQCLQHVRPLSLGLHRRLNLCPPRLQVWLLDFSPCERYLVSYSSQEPSNPREKASVLFNVFETRTGTRIWASTQMHVISRVNRSGAVKGLC